MDEQKPRHWRKWLVVVGSTVVGFVALVMIVMQIFLLSNQIPENKLAPRPELLRLTQPGNVSSNPSATPNSSAAAARPVQSGQAGGATLRQTWITRYRAHESNDSWPWTTWSLGQNFTAEQKKWIASHRAMFDDLFKTGTDENFGGMRCAAAAGMQDSDLQSLAFSSGYMNMTFFRVEFAYRREAGDLMGAAEVLLTLGKVAQSMREPFLANYSTSLFMQYTPEPHFVGLAS